MTKIPSNDGRRRVWRSMAALQEQYGYFTSTVLVALFEPGHRKTIENYLAFLAGERVVEVASIEARKNGKTNCWRIVNPGEAPPMRRNADTSLGCRQLALWTAMRSLNAFTAQELALSASTEDRVIPRETAASYLSDLERAGYLVRTDGRPAIYRLLPVRNTGPRAPIVQRSSRSAFDLNLMATVNLNTVMRRAA